MKNNKIKIVIIVVSIIILGLLIAGSMIYFKPIFLYNKGISSIKNKEYKMAIECFQKTQGYKDSREKIYECCYLMGNREFENNNLENAFYYYTIADNYSDSKQKKNEVANTIAEDKLKEDNVEEAIVWYEYASNTEKVNEVEYDYVKSNYNNTDETTYNYLKSLTKQSYKDSQEIYNELYKIKVTLIVNDSEDNAETDKLVLPQSKASKIYVHWKVEGGYPGQKIDLTITHQHIWGLDGDVGGRLTEDKWRGGRLGSGSNKDYLSNGLYYSGESDSAFIYQASNLYYYRIRAEIKGSDQIFAEKIVYTPYDF